MPLREYDEFAEEPLTFVVHGKEYPVPPLGYREGILLQRTLSGEDDTLIDAPAEDGWKLVLGPVFDQMVADNVPSQAIARAGFAAMADFQFGREAAEKVWEGGLDPKALAESVQKALEKYRVSTPSPSTGAARKTRSRASTTGTTSPTTTKRTQARARKSAS